jgi:hypothetical protein
MEGVKMQSRHRDERKGKRESFENRTLPARPGFSRRFLIRESKQGKARMANRNVFVAVDIVWR